MCSYLAFHPFKTSVCAVVFYSDQLCSLFHLYYSAVSHCVCVCLPDVLSYLNPNLSCDLWEIVVCPVPFIQAFFCQSVQFDLFLCNPTPDYWIFPEPFSDLLCMTQVWTIYSGFLDFVSAPSPFWIPGNKFYSMPPITLWIALLARMTLCLDSVSRVTGYPAISLSAGDRPLPVCFAIILIKHLYSFEAALLI